MASSWYQAFPAIGGKPGRCEVLVIGEALVDVFPDRRVVGGAPFNVARNLAGLGGRPFFISRIGDDAMANEVLRECSRFDLDTSGMPRDPRLPTGVVNVRMNGTEHRFEFAAEQAWDEIDPVACAAHMEEHRPAIVYFGTLAQRNIVSRHAIHAALEAHRCLRFFDVNLRGQPEDRAIAADSLALADIVKVNDEELTQLLRWFGREGGGLEDAEVMRLIDRFNVQLLLVTLGPAGARAFSRGEGLVASAGGVPVDVVDTVGAGDAFASVIMHGYLQDWPLQRSIERAVRFASDVCAIPGAVSEDHFFYVKWFDAWTREQCEGAI